MGVKWTEEQQQVIDLRDHNILVSAAAGSGKTAVWWSGLLPRLTKGCKSGGCRPYADRDLH